MWCSLILGLALAQEAPPPEAVEPPVAEVLPIDLEAHLRGFAAAGVSIYGSRPPGFVLGDFILAYDANLDERATFAAEVSFELLEQGATPLDVEVLAVGLHPKPGISLRVGRFRNPMTPWADRGLHGSYRFTALTAPEVLRVEHEGGLLPIHLVGVLGATQRDVGYWTVGGDLAVANGRSSWLEMVPQAGDTGWMKAVVGRFWVRTPSATTLSVAAYVDRIAPALGGEEGTPMTGELGLTTAVDERILSAAVDASSPRVELLSEGYAIWHVVGTQAPVFSSGAYLQLGLPVHDVTPYARVEYIDSRPEDPLTALFDNGRFEGKASLGCRWDLALHAALKLQGDLLSERERPVGQSQGAPATRGGAHIELSAGF